jgi:hypothetical protein
MRSGGSAMTAEIAAQETAAVNLRMIFPLH